MSSGWTAVEVWDQGGSLVFIKSQSTPFMGPWGLSLGIRELPPVLKTAFSEEFKEHLK